MSRTKGRRLKRDSKIIGTFWETNIDDFKKE